MTPADLRDFGTAVVTSGCVALWLSILIRVPAARHSQPQRRLLIAVIGIAGSVTAYLNPITALLNRGTVLGHSCGIVMNVWGVIASAFVLDFVLAALGRRRPVPVYAGAVGVSVGLFLLDTGAGAAGCVTSIAVPWYSPFWWLLSIAHVVAVLPCAVLCARYARRAETRPLRLGLGLLAAGFTSSTFFWSFVIIAYLFTGDPWLGAFFPLNIGITTWLMVAGVLVPVVARGVRAVGEARDLKALEPLWTETTTAVPHVRLPASAVPRRSLDFRLYRRVIEIRDALMVLRDHIDPAEISAARARAEAAADPAEREALAVAYWLSAAIAARGAGGGPVEPPRQPAAPPAGDADWAGEIAFLRAVARLRESELAGDRARETADPR
ncbi:MAB_1171c family putative transporter [Actinokineospora guangxiensis]|uniref:MAB_1171c family putative transporter n=1 Tax=Actinokineospora guangxiensis TaxID=1490288 RepID=A0ABW0EPS0_9PSEU